MALQQSTRNLVEEDNLYFAFASVFVYIILFLITKNPNTSLFCTLATFVFVEGVLQIFKETPLTFAQLSVRLITTSIPAFILNSVFNDMLRHYDYM